MNCAGSPQNPGVLQQLWALQLRPVRGSREAWKSSVSWVSDCLSPQTSEMPQVGVVHVVRYLAVRNEFYAGKASLVNLNNSVGLVGMPRQDEDVHKSGLEQFHRHAGQCCLQDLRLRLQSTVTHSL